MEENKLNTFLKNVLQNMPSDWLTLTTHRLDIYNESKAKVEFLEQLENLYQNDNTSLEALKLIPTAYDYIRLGHPLSCVLEWHIAKSKKLEAKSVISFSSQTTPIIAVLRENLFENKKTQILYTDNLPEFFNAEALRQVYGFNFELKKVNNGNVISKFEGSTIFLFEKEAVYNFNLYSNIDFYININKTYGSILLVNGKENESYISEIQHVRRRETIAMTPINCHKVLEAIAENTTLENSKPNVEKDKNLVLDCIKEITQTTTKPLVASSGLSMQYAIMMGLVEEANEKHPGKDIKFIVPPNCYGGTNDQARRVATCIKNVEVLDLPVDGGNDMADGVEKILSEVAAIDAVPYIIAEIPTNPRVEVPNLDNLKAALSKERKTNTGSKAVESVFILDQTFCPNVHFLGEEEYLSTSKALSYASGSKFPSGGKCTAGYCVANKKAESLISKIEKHLLLCDNEATALQYHYLAEQLPSMNDRIAGAYENTRAFVNYIQEVLPEAKINFVSEELAEQSFTPSVFSLDLPTKGNTDEERETYNRALNHQLINMMITEIPNESKYCVSYGQLKGCYWTIPATSTQGTTKEGDKDYIARVALSANMDLEKHKQVFKAFVDSI